MAITNYLVHFKTKATYDSTVASNPLRNDAVAFIQDATIIRTHGTDYHCGSGPVALKSELSTVATTGSYNDLTDKPESSETLIIDISNVDFTPGDTTSGTLTGFTFDELRNTITNNGVIILKQDGANIFAGYKQTSTTPEKYTVSYIDSTAKNYIEISSDLSYQAITLPEQLTDLGITATATELNYVDGVTSNIQTQLNGKQATITGGASSIVTNNLTESRALISDASGKVTVSPVTSTELEYLDGVTSSIQTQLNNKVSLVDGVLTLSGNSSTGNIINLSNEGVQDLNIISDVGNNIVLKKTGSSSLSITEDGILLGVDINPDILRLEVNSKTKRISVSDTSNLDITSGFNTLTITNTSNGNDVTWNDSVILTEDNWNAYITSSSIGAVNSDQLNNYLPLSGGTLTGSLFVKESGAGIFYIEQEGIAIKSTNNGNDRISIMGGGIILDLTSPNDFTIDNDQILTEANWNEYITVTDTKNTTGTSNSTSKLYLAGGTSQSPTGVVTYSNLNVYTQNGQLYATKMNAINGFYETSDARLKNFKDDIKALDVVSEIPTKYFTWKKDETDEPKLHIGTSAQEVQKIYPDLVTKNEEGELLVDYARLSVIALAAIKELKKEIEELKFIKNGGGKTK